MKTYTITLKGTKKNNTKDLKTNIEANNKSQAFNIAYLFFEKGEENYLLSDLNYAKGNYKVYRTSVK